MIPRIPVTFRKMSNKQVTEQIKLLNGKNCHPDLKYKGICLYLWMIHVPILILFNPKPFVDILILSSHKIQ